MDGAPVTFVTGKGGVGKTTIANLLARTCASHGERVLFISLYNDVTTRTLLGIADSDDLADVFPSSQSGIDVSFITPASALSNYLAAKKLASITTRLNKAGLLDMVANVVPGMRELLVMGDIRSKAQSGAWDRVIVDAPSTGHARALFDVANASKNAARSGVIRQQAQATQEFITDHNMVHVIIVTLDHVMPLSECREFVFAVEDEHHMKLAALIVNRSDVMTTGVSRGMDRELNDIFLPLFAYPPATKPEHKVEKKKSLWSSFSGKDETSLPDVLFETIALSNTTNTCIVLGTGGVGKTTTSAAIALSAARNNKRVALLTIDPARRLGTALGLDNTASRASYLDAQRMTAVSKKDASLSVYQLDSKSEFMELLERTLDEKAYKECENNSFVQAVSTMGVVNEFMAIEAMHRLVSSKEYDLVVVDTPPSHHVFDLLDAPSVLQRVFHSHVFKTLVGAGIVTHWGTNVALNTIFRPLRSLVGTELISDAVEFMRTIRDVEEVFSQHSRDVDATINSQETEFVGVCNPTSVSRDQIASVSTDMAGRGHNISTIIVNGCDLGEVDVETELVPFADKAGENGTKVSIILELEEDEPVDIVEAIAKKVIW